MDSFFWNTLCFWNFEIIDYCSIYTVYSKGARNFKFVTREIYSNSNKTSHEITEEASSCSYTDFDNIHQLYLSSIFRNTFRDFGVGEKWPLINCWKNQFTRFELSGKGNKISPQYLTLFSVSSDLGAIQNCVWLKLKCKTQIR